MSIYKVDAQGGVIDALSGQRVSLDEEALVRATLAGARHRNAADGSLIADMDPDEFVGINISSWEADHGHSE